MIVGAGALARTAFGVAIFAAVASSAASSHASPNASSNASPNASPASPFAGDVAAAEARLDARRGKPEAIVALDELLALEDGLPDGALEPALRRAAAAGADPLVAAQATFQLARLLGQRGASEEADAARASLGLFTRFSVVGSFGEGRSGFSQAFAPEGEADAPAAGRTYRGKLGDVTWRSADGVVREGALLLDGMLRPDTQATAYVVVFAKSARDQDVALRFGSPGPTKIWVDGARVFARDVVRTPIFDQDAAPARLRAGWNRIVVKTTVTEGSWRVYLRVTDPAGHALALGDGALPAGAKVARGLAAKRAPAIVTLEAALRARTGDTGAGAWFDLGRYLASAGPGDRDSREAATALEAARARQPTVATLLLLADVARDEDERRRALEGALASASEGGAVRARIVAALGDTARSQRRDDVSLARWREALALDPGCWPAALALADEEQAAGLTALALARVEALPEAVRQVARVRRQWARLLDAVGKVREADALLQGMRATRQRDVELLHDLATRARGRGDGATFVADLARAAALRPDLPSLEIEHARALEGAGDEAGARNALTALAARLPDDASVLAHLGKLLHRQGRRDEALARLHAALALRPQDPELRRYVARAARTDAVEPNEDLARHYAVDARALVRDDARHVFSQEADAAVLLDCRAVRVHENGLAQTFAQRVVAIHTDHGAEDNKEFDVRYTPGTEDVEIRQARVYRRTQAGELEVLEAAERDDEDLSEPWYGLYYDNRAEIVRFAGLRAGDVLEVQYVIEDVSAENQMADYFGDLESIAESLPKQQWDYTLLAPTTRPIYSNTPRVPGLARDTKVQGDERVYSFSARGIAAVDAEPAMPGLAEIAPYLHVSTYATWDDVGAWYWRLVEDQLTPDDELRRAARAVVKPGDSEEARVRAIHDLVVTQTRYVGLEFGIHGFKPYKVTQVLERRFGDCKDKASLLVAMLKEVGVDAELVLVRTRRGGLVDREPASLAVFDHAIAYVPKLDLYLDGTAEFSGTSELPSQDQGVMVLRVGPHGAKLAETPVLPSAANHVERRWRVDLAVGGDAHVDEQLTIRGQAAADWREHYQTPGERAERYGRVWEARYPGARLASIETPRIEDRDAPVVVRSTASVPRLGTPAGADVTLPLAVREADFSRTYARLGARKQDLVIAYPWQHDEEIVYRLPEGWTLRAGAAPRQVTSPFGHLSVDVAAEAGGLVRVHTFLDVTRYRVTPAEYAAFRSFLGDIDAAFAERITVGPAGAAP